MNKVLLASIYTILKPLISLMYHNGVAFGDFSKLARQAYIEVTEKELLDSGEKATTSRIAIITGLTRKEVAALRKQESHTIKHESHYNRAVRVISRWAADPEFSDEYGEPKELPIKGEEFSFEALVNRYSGDMPYRAMLSELTRTHAVEINNDKVKLVRVAHIPNDDNKYALLGEDVSLLLSTIRHNIFEENEEPRYERKVSYQHIPEKKLKAFKKIANRESQKLLMRLNNWLAKYSIDNQLDSNTDQPEKTKHVGVGIYYFEEENFEEKHNTATEDQHKDD